MLRVLVPYHLDEHLPDLDIPVIPDTSITADLPDGDPWTRMAALYQPVAATVAAAAARGDRPVVCSGDCTTSLGVLAGLQRAGLDPAIVWLDGHGDVQTLETTSSGYLGGLALRLHTGYRPELIAGRLGLRPVPESRVVLAGARDLDPPELTYLAGSAIRRLEVAELAAGPAPERGQGTGPAPGPLPETGPLFLHVDLDVVNPAELPDLLFPAAGGPGIGEVTAAVRAIIATGRVAAISLGCTWRQPGHPAADRLRQPVGELLAGWR